jgi:membrane protein required for colicin V production
MFNVNMLDTALIVILLFFGIKGLIRGLVQEVAGLLGVAAGILLARAFSAKLAPVLTGYGVSSGFSPVLSMALLFLAGVLVVGLAAHILHNLLESAFVGGIDRFLGLLAGLAKGLIFTGVIGYIAIKLVPDMQIVKQSQVLPPLMDFIQALAGSLDLNIPKLR